MGANVPTGAVKAWPSRSVVAKFFQRGQLTAASANGDAFEGRNPKYSWRNPGFAQGDDHPVVNVSWNDAVAMARWLSAKEGAVYR
ncbi:MAG: hypothetical protein JWQ41_1976, partial [Variovorax sp.]|nr:hypothetical protein [Variovorax sp.]